MSEGEASMSEGAQNISDEQPVVGEPASHPHQAVVVGEPPEDVAPVLGEPAFANGLQDQQLVLPPSSEETSDNGVQCSPDLPANEEEVATVEPSSDVNVPSSAEDTLVLQHASSTDDGIGEASTHQQEAAAAGAFNPPDSHVDEVTRASDDSVPGSTDAATPNRSPVSSAEEQPAVDFPEVVEVTHIVDNPAEASLPPFEIPTENSFVTLGDDSETTPEEVLDDDTQFMERVPSSTPEVSLKGLDNQQKEASPSPAAQEEESMEKPASVQLDLVDGPREGSKADDDYVQAAEAEKVGRGSSSVVENPLTPELDGTSKTDAPCQGNDASEHISGESESMSGEGVHVMTRETPQSEALNLESSTPEKVIPNESHDAPTAVELPSTGRILDEASPIDQGTRVIAEEECAANHRLQREASFTATANGGNSHEYGEDGELEREQDLPKDGDDASEEVEKSSFRSKLPLIFTGLAIAAVGVAVASISRPR